MTIIGTLSLGVHQVARYDDGSAVEAAWGPRPFLHPVTTLAGVRVTDAQPEDHRWHVGVSVALQDVDGTNFWGGRTYRQEDAYQWRDDHGKVRHAGFTSKSTDGWSENLAWVDRHDRRVLTEHRSVGAVLRHDASAWSLDFEFSLTNVSGRRLALGSPATNGREGGGYGGFFWRLPAYSGDLTVFTAEAVGESGAHGSTEPWVALSAADEAGRPWTVLLEHRDAGVGPDPWFVRVGGYPGVGSALAWSRPVVLEPTASVSRAFRATMVDLASAGTGDVRPWLANPDTTGASGTSDGS